MPSLRARLYTASSAAIAIAVVAAAVLVATWINMQAEEASRLVSRSIDVRERSERFLTTLLDAETGQRGFLLTGDEHYLAPYESSQAELLPSLDRIERLVAYSPTQTERVQRTRGLTIRKLAEMAETITLMRAGRREDAVRLVTHGTGNTLTQDLRDIVGAVQLEENHRLAASSRREARRRVLASAGILVALAGLCLAAWLQLRLRHRRAVTLSSSNADLERKVAERTHQLENERMRIEALLRDVNHRVGNNLAMVSALLNVQSRQTREAAVKQALAQAQSRIQAIAAGQRRLRLDIEADEIEARPYLEDLLAEIGKAAEGRPIEIALAMDAIRLPGRDAVSFVVVINELVTNAIKHAFPDGAAGRITIRLGRTPEEKLVLSVEDDGIGMPQDQQTAGLGKSVITSLLRSMRASMETTPLSPGTARPGTRVAITFPKRERTAEDDAAA
ncbi:CHASE3 domain-containing protein [Bosea sp. CS1GBMeth4]|uniref:sensor histidine kinase n=1 Tax=Bosea sp. CS1GBMeth4 TaxID=1892849 RepID=UPI001648E49B|nr:CHASE3 domain-containing protein [Bosea sp. CS1GBMeth4]